LGRAGNKMFKFKPIMICGFKTLPRVGSGDLGAIDAGIARNIARRVLEKLENGGHSGCSERLDGLAYNSSSSIITLDITIY
jgi:hypothetical protein